MFKMSKLQRPVPSLSMAAAIVAATLAAGCGATDSPTAPETITDTGLVSLDDVVTFPNRRGPMDPVGSYGAVAILPFTFNQIRVQGVRRIGPDKFRVRFLAYGMASLDCQSQSTCEQLFGNIGTIHQGFDMVLDCGGLPRAGVKGSTRGEFSAAAFKEAFRGRLRGSSTSCEGFIESGAGRADVQMDVKARFRGGGSLNLNLRGTFQLSTDPLSFSVETFGGSGLIEARKHGNEAR